MSQILNAGVGGTPSVPTSFTTDLIDLDTVALSTVGNGTVVPQANVLRLGGDNGIKTYEIDKEAGSLTVGFIRGSGTTTNVQTTAIITQAVPDNSAMTIQIIAAGYADNTQAAGLYGTAVVKNIGGTVTVVSGNANGVDLIKNTDATLATVDLTVTASTSNFVVSVVGVAGRTIEWSVALPGIVAS